MKQLKLKDLKYGDWFRFLGEGCHYHQVVGHKANSILTRVLKPSGHFEYFRSDSLVARKPCRKIKKTMSIQVKQFDETKANLELKKCPKIVRDYVKLLREHLKRQQDLTAKAIGELIKKSTQ